MKQPKYGQSVLDISKTEEANNMSNIMLSVVRDMTIAGYYGYLQVEKYHGLRLPSALDLFAEDLATVLQRRFLQLRSVYDTDFDLYGTHGDLLSWLSRLLLHCRENDQLSKHIENANCMIDDLKLPAWFHDGHHDYIRHMRNSIAHAKSTVLVNRADWEKSEIVFIDTQSNGKITAELIVTSSQLTEIIKIILNEVYDKRLTEIGWAIGSFEGQ